MAVTIGRPGLASMLRQHGEWQLAERALLSSDDEMARIGSLAAYYAWSEDAQALNRSMGGARAFSLAALDVLEGTRRDLRLSRPDGLDSEVDGCSAAQQDIADRELRRNAVRRQLPADESRETLDKKDPPGWGPTPADVSPEVARCYALRTKPLKDLTHDDLAFLLERGMAPTTLVPLAISRLRPDASADGTQDLFKIVLRLDPGYWERSPDPDVALRIISDNFTRRSETERQLLDLIDAFKEGHSKRRQSFWGGLTA